jgi:dynein heavy chain
LDEQEIELTKKNTKAEELIKIVKKEKEKVKYEKDKGIYNISKLFYS